MIVKQHSKVPGVGRYESRFEKTWDLQLADEGHALKFSKNPRLLESEEIMKKANKGLVTPGPNAYKVLESAFLPLIGKQGGFRIE